MKLLRPDDCAGSFLKHATLGVEHKPMVTAGVTMEMIEC
jgi:hypothetical protein